MSAPALDVVVVGGGPSGLAVAIALHNAGLGYVVLEKGVLVNSIFRFPRAMVFFTTAELLEIGGLPFVTPYEKPTRSEALRYYRRVVDHYELHLRLGVEVTGLARRNSCFAVTTRESTGRPESYLSRAVVFATGYYDHPNRLGIPGEELPHVSHYYTEAHGYYRKDVVVVGGKNSAAIAALELWRAGARVTLVHRGEGLGASVKYWIKPDIENRIRDGAIPALFGTRVVEIREDSVLLDGESGRRELPADAVLLLTGYHPDISLLASVGVEVDPEKLIPRHDPSTLETNVPGVYLAGALVAGRQTGRIFIENGRFHGEMIAVAIQAKARAGL